MDNSEYSVLFIMVPPIDDYDSNEQRIQSLDNVLNNIFPYLKGEVLLACSHSNPSLNFAQYINSRCFLINGRDFFSSFTAFGDKSYKEKNNELEDHEFVKQYNLSYCFMPTYPKNIILDSLQTSIEGKGSILIIAENNLFEILEQSISIRKEDQFTYGVLHSTPVEPYLNQANYYVPNQDADDYNEKICEELQRYLRTKPISQLFEEKLRLLDNTNLELNSCKANLEIIEKAVKHLSVKMNSSLNVSESLINKFDQEVKLAEEQLKACTSIVDYAVDMKNTFGDQKIKKDEDSFLEIRKFYYNEDLGIFKLQIENSTDFDYYNVSVFILETGYKLCDFSLIEKKTKVWKETDTGYRNDIYGFHLIVVSQNEIVIKEPYFISKCKLRVIERGEEIIFEGDYPKKAEMVYTVEVKNYSCEPIKELLLNIPESVVGLKFTSAFLDYSEITQEEFYKLEFEEEDQLEYNGKYMVSFKAHFDFNEAFKSRSENYKIFVCCENSIVSNTILLNDVKT